LVLSPVIFLIFLAGLGPMRRAVSEVQGLPQPG
jgi:hypothetical protein